MNEKSKYGPLLLRIAIGAIFLYTGIGKLLNPAGPTGMLQGLGFPAPAFFAWVLLLSEIIFGLSVLLGWKVRYTVWPLVLIMVIAIFAVVLPNANGNYLNALFHLLVIAGSISLFLTGPGAAAVDKN
jgi:putative oxidoreductase